MKTIGERIKNKRKELGLTQAELAQKLNVTDRAVSKWEVDEGNPDIGIIPALCNVLGVTTDYLLLGKEEEAISLDDMDKSKRFDYLIKKDDAANFVKYKYIYDIFRYHTYDNIKLPNIREQVILDLIKNKKKNILRLVFDELVSYSKEQVTHSDKKRVYANIYVSSYIDQFIKAAVDYDRDDVLEALGVKYLPLAKESKTKKPEYSTISQSIFFRSARDKDSRTASTCDVETIEYIFANKDKHPKCYQYITDLTLEKDYALPIESLVIDLCINYKDYKKLEEIFNIFNAPVQEAKFHWDSHLRYSDTFANGIRLIPFSEKTIKSLLDAKEHALAEKMLAHNKLILEKLKVANVYPKDIFTMTDSELSRYKKSHSKDISDDELMELNCVFNHIIDVEELVKTKNLKFVRKVLDNNYLNMYEYAYDALTNKTSNRKGVLFKELVDSDDTSGAQRVLFASNEKRKKEMLEYFWERSVSDNQDPTGFGGISESAYTDKWRFINEHRQNQSIRDFVKEYGELNKLIDKTSDNPIIKYIHQVKDKIYKRAEKLVEDDKAEEQALLEREQAIKGLTRDYFEKLLSDENGKELFIIKLCALFDAIIKYDFKIEGEEFSDRMNTYFVNEIKKCPKITNYEEDDEEIKSAEQEKIEKMKDLFNKLRMQRNNIAHSETYKVGELSKDELNECLDYVFSINKRGE